MQLTHYALSMPDLPISYYLILENSLFFTLATLFLILAGWAWRKTKPYTLPEPLPGWFKIWFGTVQVTGGILPLIALIWGVWRGYPTVLLVLIPYLVILGLQIISEILTLRQFQSVVWVFVPYVYLPYRFWQLYEGLTILSPNEDLIWIRYLLILNLIIWIGNYLLDVTQLPKLLCWPME
ncbi:MAG: hypothetical protein ACOC3E_01120, partial [Cyanobacteriota bacterium]